MWLLLGREMPLEDGDAARQRGQWVNGKVSGTPWLGETGDPLLQDMTAPDGSRMGPALGDKDVTPKGALQQAGQCEEALMTELSELVQKVVKSSSWWERHGVDISILSCSFLLLPAGNPAQQPPKPQPGGSRCLLLVTFALLVPLDAGSYY